ncbi:biliverdin-producing heme oxygenase [Flavitalea antarctica]
MFSKELKEYTAEAHTDLERKMIPHLKKISSRDEYVNLLDFMHGFYEPLEERLAPFLPEGPSHSPSANIVKDINELDAGYQLSGKKAPGLPDIHSAANALGVLYVIEGSTLGGQIITKMLSKQIESDSTGGFSFYNPYGEETLANWNNFKKKLDQPFDENEKKEIIEGANETFRTLNNWISNYDGYKHR